MKIQDKLLEDKKHLGKDIDVAIEKINEYASIIDTLANKIKTAKEALEFISEMPTVGNHTVVSAYAIELAKKTLQELES